MNDPESSVRAAAAHALGVLKAKDAVPALIAMLSDTDVEAAVAAANALAELADPAALDTLISVVTATATPAPLYDAAANALAKIQDPRAVPILVKLLESPKENVRWASADALGGLGVADAVKPLATVALKDQNPQNPRGRPRRAQQNRRPGPRSTPSWTRSPTKRSASPTRPCARCSRWPIPTPRSTPPRWTGSWRPAATPWRPPSWMPPWRNSARTTPRPPPACASAWPPA